MIESLEVRNVVKRFSGVTALKNMHFKLRGGSVHCLVGENGAGKSTLIKILAGHYMPDEGEIALDGQPLRIANPRESQRLGISIIHQELLLVPELSVAENISLGRLPKAGAGLIDWKSAQQRAASALALLNAAIDPQSKVAELSTGSSSSSRSRVPCPSTRRY